MVADIEELETMDASEIHSKRFNAKEVILPKRNGKIMFPVADGRIKLPGGDQELRTSTLIRDHPIRGEGQRNFLEESEGSPPSPPQDSYPDAGEARNDFWPFQQTSYTAITLNLELYFTRRKKNHSLFHWNTLTSLELLIRIWMLSKNVASMTIGISQGQEICLILGQVSQLTLLSEKPPDGYMWSGWRRTKTASDIQARSFMARRTLGRIGKKC